MTRICITGETLTDEQIREEWNADVNVLRPECYYALKRNARKRAGVQGDDEFSRFCEECAAAVAASINDRIGKVAHQIQRPSMYET